MIFFTDGGFVPLSLKSQDVGCGLLVGWVANGWGVFFSGQSAQGFLDSNINLSGFLHFSHNIHKEFMFRVLTFTEGLAVCHQKRKKISQSRWPGHVQH